MKKIILIIGSILLVLIFRKPLGNRAMEIPAIRRMGVRFMLGIPYFRKRLMQSMFSNR
ncbi:MULTISPECIES: hypothetical protein [Gracilibacillus]|uniref:hypothetical protein n=1 Tax=Gracilibacillus TaxID=74385 RepID=UPI000B05FBB6|nr:MULTISPECIES: hypothetical protein [Gracilibacillus]